MNIICGHSARLSLILRFCCSVSSVRQVLTSKGSMLAAARQIAVGAAMRIAIRQPCALRFEQRIEMAGAPVIVHHHIGGILFAHRRCSDAPSRIERFVCAQIFVLRANIHFLLHAVISALLIASGQRRHHAQRTAAAAPSALCGMVLILSNLIQRLTQIGDDIINMFNTHRHADNIWPRACRSKARVVKLAVRGGGGVDDERAGVANVR